MILLEPENVIIKKVVNEKLQKPTSLDQTFVDFDGVRYHMWTPNSKYKNEIILSMSVACWSELEAYGAFQVLQQHYGSDVQKGIEPGYDVSISIDLNTIPQDSEQRNQYINNLSLLKRNAMSAPFLQAFQTQKQLEGTDIPTDGSPIPQGPLLELHYRNQEAIYIQAGIDRVTVIFSTVFQEETDKIFGRVFLQEFVDARKLPSIQTAPQVLYSTREPPLEIRHLPNLIKSDDVGYVTFVLFPRHFSNEHIAASTISRIQLFRNYLHYHIKCSKAYMHSRMRTRVADFLKILNRAKLDKTESERKTITGRTFRSR